MEQDTQHRVGTASRPLITFIVPTYNRAHVVCRAVDSALREFSDSGEAEFIVIDDGSTDDTAARLERYADDPQVRRLRFAANCGLAAARNAAIAEAKGDWLALLDSDNVLTPGSGVTIRRLLAAAPPEVGVVWAGGLDSDGARTVTHDRSGILSGREIVEEGIGGEHFSLVRRGLALACPYPTDAGHHGCEPVFWAAMASRTHFLVAQDICQIYDTTGADRICTAANRIQRARDFARCFELTAACLDRVSEREASRARARAAFYTVLAGDQGAGISRAFRVLVRGPLTPDAVYALAASLAGTRATRVAARLR